MDTTIETRKGMVRTMIFNHLLSAVFSFVIILAAFKWLYDMGNGIVILFTASGLFYLSGIYSYVYEQPRLDLILKKKYDWLMPLKTGAFASLIIFIFTGVQFIINIFSPFYATLYGVLAKFMNYFFFYFLYGRNGDYYNVPALILILILPVIVAYLAYYAGVKKFSFGKLYGKMLYKKTK